MKNKNLYAGVAAGFVSGKVVKSFAYSLVPVAAVGYVIMHAPEILAKLGFEKALLPASRRKGGKAVSGGLDLVEISRLHDLVDLLHDPGDDARIGRRVVQTRRE